MKLFSVITICYNEKNNIARTIESVLSQSYDNYEYIVVDGLSTDGTCEIINSYRQKFCEKKVDFTIISEKDSGIYNAMNKGVKLAKGMFVNMMNAGDAFANDEILKNVSEQMNKNMDIVYGNVHCIAIRRNKLIRYPFKPKSLETITRVGSINQQATFARTKLLLGEPFDEGYKIAADYKFFLSMYLAERFFEYLDIHVADFYLGGISSKQIYQAEKEFLMIRDEAGLVNQNSFSSKRHLFNIRILVIARKITPRWFRKLFGGGKI